MTVAGKSGCFKKAASELGCDRSEEAFDEALRKVARRNSTDEKPFCSPKPKA